MVAYHFSEFTQPYYNKCTTHKYHTNNSNFGNASTFVSQHFRVSHEREIMDFIQRNKLYYRVSADEVSFMIIAYK